MVGGELTRQKFTDDGNAFGEIEREFTFADENESTGRGRAGAQRCGRAGPQGFGEQEITRTNIGNDNCGIAFENFDTATNDENETWHRAIFFRDDFVRLERTHFETFEHGFARGEIDFGESTKRKTDASLKSIRCVAAVLGGSRMSFERLVEGIGGPTRDRCSRRTPYDAHGYAGGK